MQSVQKYFYFTGPTTLILADSDILQSTATIQIQDENGDWNFYGDIGPGTSAVDITIEGQFRVVYKLVACADNPDLIEPFTTQALESSCTNMVSTYTSPPFNGDVLMVTGYPDGGTPYIYRSGLDGQPVLTNINLSEVIPSNISASAYDEVNDVTYIITPDVPSTEFSIYSIDASGSSNVFGVYQLTDIVGFPGTVADIMIQGATAYGGTLYLVTSHYGVGAPITNAVISIDIATGVATYISNITTMDPYTSADLVYDPNGGFLYGIFDGKVSVYTGTDFARETHTFVASAGYELVGASAWINGVLYQIERSFDGSTYSYNILGYDIVNGIPSPTVALSGIDPSMQINDATGIENYTVDPATYIVNVNVCCDDIDSCCFDSTGNIVECPPALDITSVVENNIPGGNQFYEIIANLPEGNCIALGVIRSLSGALEYFRLDDGSSVDPSDINLDVNLDLCCAIATPPLAVNDESPLILQGTSLLDYDILANDSVIAPATLDVTTVKWNVQGTDPDIVISPDGKLATHTPSGSTLTIDPVTGLVDIVNANFLTIGYTVEDSNGVESNVAIVNINTYIDQT